MLRTHAPSARPDAPDEFPQDAVRLCRDITRLHASSFFLASRLLDSRRRAAVWAVYAACRLGDDLVDEGGRRADERRADLEAWWQAVQDAYAGRPGEGVWRALAWAVRTYPVPLAAFEELREGFLTDLRGGDCATLADLELYCRRVAGVVGFMVAPICGFAGGEATLRRALRLGQAMQLTNVLRDVGEDLMKGRLYLPADLLARHGVTRADLARGDLTPQYAALMKELMALARAWYAEGEEGILALHGRARGAVLLAARAYALILNALERGGYDNFGRRPFASTAQKLALLPGVLLTARPSFFPERSVP